MATAALANCQLVMVDNDVDDAAGVSAVVHGGSPQPGLERIRRKFRFARGRRQRGRRLRAQAPNEEVQ